jgi:phosphatidylglycerol:prolipoprotein diacylglycerol transferase
VALSSGIYLAGYLTGAAAFLLMARRRRLLTDGVMILLAIGLIGGLVCAAIAQWLVGGGPGKSVIGGLAGGYLCVWAAKRALGIRRPLGDLFAVALAAGEAVGRWGCFFAGCCYGTACALPWAVWQHGMLRHPSQIYSSAASLAILSLLLIYERTRPPENSLFRLQGVLFCSARFAIEFFRDGSHNAAGLSVAQWACLAGAAFFAYQMYVNRRVSAASPTALTADMTEARAAPPS